MMISSMATSTDGLPALPSLLLRRRPGDAMRPAAQMKGKGSIKVDAGDTGSIRAGYDQTYEVSDNPPEAELTGSYGGNRYWTTSAAAY
jgi:hypothetical protein